MTIEEIKLLIFSLIIFFTLSVTLTYFYIRYAWRKNWLDTPNTRSSHSKSTPRGGGLIFITLWIIAILLGFFFHTLSAQQIIILLPGTLCVAITGFCDDRYHLCARWRACIYLIAAIYSVIALGGFTHLMINEKIILSLGVYGTIFAVLAVFWSINLFNFMDGLDGIAATEAILTLSVGGFFIAQAGGQTLALDAWILATCVAGFLVWNKPPAKIFMGDVGSTSLGFVIMILALWGEKQYHVPALLWFILYGVFLVDTTLTLCRRLLAKEPIYSAHRLHAYQRLQQMGFSHKNVWLMISGINILLALLAIAGFYHPAYLLLCALIAVGILLVFYVWTECRKPMY